MRRICFILLFLIIYITANYTVAGEYKVIVLPNSTIDFSIQKNVIEKYDIEELLSNKIISGLDATGTACAPTLDILRIAVLNNPYISKSAKPDDNARLISDSYNVSKFIVVKSHIKLVKAAEQKEIWNKLNLPAVSSTEDVYQLITTVSMYDNKSGQIIWNDVFYYKLNNASEGMKSIKLSTISAYYDTLSYKIISELKPKNSNTASSHKDKIPEIKPVVINKTQNNITTENSSQEQDKSVKDKLKNTYDSIKQKYETNKEEKVKADEKSKLYTDIHSSGIEEVPQVNSYIQKKPRNNARNYTPKFDSSVNDI